MTLTQAASGSESLVLRNYRRVPFTLEFNVSRPEFPNGISVFPLPTIRYYFDHQTRLDNPGETSWDGGRVEHAFTSGFVSGIENFSFRRLAINPGRSTSLAVVRVLGG